MSDIGTSIHDFINNVFTPQCVENINQAISLFEAFDHQNAYGGMMDAVNDESVSDLAGRADHFIVELCKQLDLMIRAHLMMLTDEATLRNRIVVLDALYRVQHLEDYTEITAILSTEQEPIETMAMIFASLTEFDDAYFLEILKSVHPHSLDLMAQFVQDKAEDRIATVVNPVLIERIRTFDQALGDKHIGNVLLDAGMTPGYPVRLYLPFIQNYLIVSEKIDEEGRPVNIDYDQTAKNILSLLYMSDIQEVDMLTAYRTVAEFVIKDLTETSRVETFVIKHLAVLNDTRKVNHEKAGLPQESAPSQSGG